MGRSRGGLTTKMHALVDGEGMPLKIGLTAGERHDNTLARDPPGRFARRRAGAGWTAATMRVGSDRLSPTGAAGPTSREEGLDRKARADRVLVRRASTKSRNAIERFLRPPQAIPRHRHPLRQTRRQLPRRGQARLPQAMAAPLRVHVLNIVPDDVIELRIARNVAVAVVALDFVTSICTIFF